MAASCERINETAGPIDGARAEVTLSYQDVAHGSYFCIITLFSCFLRVQLYHRYENFLL